MSDGIYPILARPKERQERIREQALAGLRDVFPMQLDRHTLELEDAQLKEQSFSPSQQKKAILSGGNLFESVQAKLALRNADGKVVDRIKTNVLHLPYLTPRGTFVVKGTEYEIPNQLRFRPGVYTRHRVNGDLEAWFNRSRGANFRVAMDPSTSHFGMELGATRIPLYPVLKGLGIPDKEIQNQWGKEILSQNQDWAGSDKAVNTAIGRLYKKLTPAHAQTAKSLEQRQAAIREHLSMDSLDSEVMRTTLGTPTRTADPATVLQASGKLLRVFKGEAEPDDRTSTPFLSIHSADDFFRERMNLDARALRRKLAMKLRHKGTSLDKVVPPGMFTRGLRNFITTSALSANPTQINPIEMIDHASKITFLGEGGIADDRAVPPETRRVHWSQVGIIDPIRTPESFNIGIDVRAAVRAGRDQDGRLYARLLDDRGNQTWVPATALPGKNIAFPNQPDRGRVDVLNTGEIRRVPVAQVDYRVPSGAHLHGVASNLVPFVESSQGNRLLMGAKMATQAVPLVEREVPLIQVGERREDRSFEDQFGRMVVPTSPVEGRVAKIDKDFIYIRPARVKKAAYIEKRAWGVVKYRQFKHIRIAIENPKDSTRSGVDTDGHKWSQKMRDDYGYIPGTTTSADKEGLDAFVGTDLSSTHVFVIHQLDGHGDFDELKVMIGYPNERTAKAHYLHNYDKTWGEHRIKQIDKFTNEEFRDRYIPEFKKAAASQRDLIRVPYDTNFPLSSKTFLQNDLSVKVGDKVKARQPLAESNFTRGSTLALGKNLDVGYMPYRGLNSNDAVVVSEGAAKKMTSSHMYQKRYLPDVDSIPGRKLHETYFGNKYTKDQYKNLNSKGVARPGSLVVHGDPIIVGVRKTKPTAEAQILGRFHKSLVKPYAEEAITWDHEEPGEIIDVVQQPNGRTAVTVKMNAPVQIGDKLSNRYGGKGVVSAIIPNEQMVRRPDGKPVDLLWSGPVLISRINPAQIIETAAAKVAKKLGKPIRVRPYAGHDNVAWAKKLLKDNGLSDKEDLLDPVTGKTVKDVMVGPQYIYKLFKSTDTNFSSAGVGSYDLNQQPSSHGETGAKRLGRMEINALLAHNARNILREATTVKSDKQDEFWRSMQLGQPLPSPKASFAYDKFLTLLQGGGVRVKKDKDILSFGPLTDNDIKKLDTRALKNPLMVRAKDLRPERGGLFDPAITGGPQGQRWSHIDLDEPVINPVFVEPVRRLLGETEKGFRERLAKTGGGSIKKELNSINVGSRLRSLGQRIPKASASARDDLIKQRKYLEALRDNGLRPGDAYVVSRVPVIPPVARPFVPTKGSKDLLISDVNYLYRDTMLANDALKEAKKLLPPHEVAKARGHLQDSVGAVFGMNDPVSPQQQGRNARGLLGIVFGSNPKSSYFQSRLMRRPQALSSRGTAAPDMSLEMDEFGMPEEMAWANYGPFVMRRLVRNGYPATDAKQMIEDKVPAAHTALVQETRERPVLLNRAPTLHRHGIVAAYPRLIPGKTIRVNPYIEEGMNLDYDGDTLQLHVPASPTANDEAKRLTLPNMLFTDKQRDALLVFPQQEAILGTWLASHGPRKGVKAKKFKTQAEAMQAYHQGKLKLDDPVKIG